MGQLKLKQDEVTCVDTCITKRVNANQRLMTSYVEINPEFQERKMKEMEASAAGLNQQATEEK